MKTVNLKNVDWIVHEDGSIWTTERDVLCTRVRNGVTQTYTHHVAAQALSPCMTKTGYLEVSAKHNGKRVRALVHRLIGLAFVSGYQNGLTINHINGIKTDNRPENLEWVSLAQNTKHQWETGLVDLRGEKAPSAKLTSKQVVYIRRLLNQGIPAHQLSVIANVSESTIHLIKQNKRWASVA